MTFQNSIFQLALSTFAAFKLAGVKLCVHFECVEINEGEDIQGATHLAFLTMPKNRCD